VDSQHDGGGYETESDRNGGAGRRVFHFSNPSTRKTTSSPRPPRPYMHPFPLGFGPGSLVLLRSSSPASSLIFATTGN
jgi:hypothetical protein